MTTEPIFSQLSAVFARYNMCIHESCVSTRYDVFEAEGKYPFCSIFISGDKIIVYTSWCNDHVVFTRNYATQVERYVLNRYLECNVCSSILYRCPGRTGAGPAMIKQQDGVNYTCWDCWNWYVKTPIYIVKCRW